MFVSQGTHSFVVLLEEFGHKHFVSRKEVLCTKTEKCILADGFKHYQTLFTYLEMYALYNHKVSRPHYSRAPYSPCENANIQFCLQRSAQVKLQLLVIYNKNDLNTS